MPMNKKFQTFKKPESILNKVLTMLVAWLRIYKKNQVSISPFPITSKIFLYPSAILFMANRLRLWK